MASLKDLIVMGPARFLEDIYGNGANLSSLNATNITSGTLSAARLSTSGVSAGTYGQGSDATPGFGGTISVPYLTVDQYGRVTGASTSTVTIPNALATTSANGLMSSVDKTKLKNTNIAYGICETAAATAAKVITTAANTNWELTTGALVTILFTYTNTASNPTFNVNGTGAKNVFYEGAQITTGNKGYAGTTKRMMTFVYDGTQYRFVAWAYDGNTNTYVRTYKDESSTYPILASRTAASAWDSTYESVYGTIATNITMTPSTGTINATAFVGDGSGLTSLDMDNAGSGTLSVARGGTGNTTQTANRIIYASNSTTLSSSNHYMSSTQASFGTTAAPSTGVTLRVEGVTHINSGLQVTGRVANNGDDEGIVVAPANNGYAGLCLGSPSGTRSVFYLKGTDAWWRHVGAESTVQGNIYHPKVSGTIAVVAENITGTTNALPKFSASYSLTNSNISDNGTTVSLGTKASVTLASGNITTSGDVIAAYVKVSSVATETDKANGFLATIASNSYIRKISYGDAVNWGLQKLSTGSSDPQDADYFISQYAGGGTTNPEFYRRPVSALWNYMNKKAASVYAKLASPNNMIHNSNEVCWVPDNYNNYIWVNYRSVGGTNKSTVTGYKFGNCKGSTADVFVEAATFSMNDKAKMTYNATDECIDFMFS